MEENLIKEYAWQVIGSQTTHKLPQSAVVRLLEWYKFSNLSSSIVEERLVHNSLIFSYFFIIPTPIDWYIHRKSDFLILF
jgi:hypothetical protein